MHSSFCFAAAAHAQSYPNKPVKLLVGFAAGGPTDVIARILAQDMTQTLGQTVLVENKAGATSMIATQEVKRAPADGYTLYMTTLTHSVNAVLHADKKPYDPIADFTPITLVAHLPLVMVAKGDSPFNTAADVVKAAKAKPGEISYASSGSGGSAHLAGALVEALTGTKMIHVPFKGNAPALTEVMAGRISFMFYPMIGIADHVAPEAAQGARREHREAPPRLSRRADDVGERLPGIRGIHAGSRRGRPRRPAGACGHPAERSRSAPRSSSRRPRRS